MTSARSSGKTPACPTSEQQATHTSRAKNLEMAVSRDRIVVLVCRRYQLHPQPPPALPDAPRAPSRTSLTWNMYSSATGLRDADMIGSASAARSYGLTQGSRWPQA